MNVFRPQQVFIKLSAALLLLGFFATCQTQSAHEALKQDKQPAVASAQQLSVDANVSGALVDQKQQRTYYLHTPPSYQPNHPMPLVLALHGSGEQGKEMAAQTGLNDLADRQGFIVVYPDGLNKKWNVSGIAPEDNVQFVHALVTHLSQIRAVDPQRIYAVGLSNGGILVQKLACENPSQFAAFATVAASLPAQFKSHCQTQTPVSMLMINSTTDPVVPWDGGESPQIRVGRNLSIPPVSEVIDFWRQHNGCSAKADTKELSDNRVQVQSYQNCQAGSSVTLIELNGGGHIWPGGGYGQSQFLDATKTVWNFFQGRALTSVAQS
jgi:polyhydroxybutyrate depolymerase